MIVFYHQIKTLIDIWCRQKLKPTYLIQLLETLLIELTKIHRKTEISSTRKTKVNPTNGLIIKCLQSSVIIIIIKTT